MADELVVASAVGVPSAGGVGKGAHSFLCATTQYWLCPFFPRACSWLSYRRR